MKENFITSQVIYQTDTCRIFHINIARILGELKDEMESR